MQDAHRIRIGTVDESVVNAINNTMGSIMEANADLRAATATNIEKKGFTYPGDTHQNWGLRGGWGTGFVGGAPFYGRGPETFWGFSMQPFGIGTNGLLQGGSISPSIFSGSGSGARFSKTTHLAHLKMALGVEAYKGFGIVKNIIDLMCNFAAEGIKIIHPSPAIQKFYQRWFEAVGMSGRVKDIFRSYYKWGNVFIYTTMGKIDQLTYRKMKNAKGSRDADLVNTNDPSLKKRRKFIDKEKSDPIGEKEIPWRYTLLNPLQMDLKGSKFFGESHWVFVPDEETKQEIENSSGKQVDVLDETDINLPLEFRKLDKEGNYIVLDQAKLWTMHYMKDDHEDWADPMVWPVMNDIMYKQQLRSMDMSVTNSVINAITIFKLGSIKDGFVAPKEHYKKLSEMLRTPTYSHNIVWNDAITMESNYPPIEKILSVDKYKSVDRDILAGLGIPGILVNGAEGGSFANAFLQVRTLLERLEEGRETVMEWLNQQLRIVAEIMGHREIPTVKFGQMSLKDEQAEKNLIIQLLDRNIISAERVHEIFDIETEIEVERLRREAELSEEENIMTKFGPFKDPMNMMDQEEMMELDHTNEMEKVNLQNKVKTQTKNQIRRPGRPTGTKKPQSKKRTTKPKGMGLGSFEYDLIRTKAANAYEAVENSLTAMILNARGLKYKKQLSKADREDLENLVFSVYSNIDIYSVPTDDDIAEILSNPFANQSVAQLYQEVQQCFGESMTAEQRREARIIAMSHYNSQEE